MIAIAPSHKGRLHAKLGVAPGKKLSVSEEEKAKHSSSPAERKEANFALNARKWKHGGKKAHFNKLARKMG